MPRACAVEVHVLSYLAWNVKLHGASPWHLLLAASVKLQRKSP